MSYLRIIPVFLSIFLAFGLVRGAGAQGTDPAINTTCQTPDLRLFGVALRMQGEETIKQECPECTAVKLKVVLKQDKAAPASSAQTFLGDILYDQYLEFAPLTSAASAPSVAAAADAPPEATPTPNPNQGKALQVRADAEIQAPQPDCSVKASVSIKTSYKLPGDAKVSKFSSKKTVTFFGYLKAAKGVK